MIFWQSTVKTNCEFKNEGDPNRKFFWRKTEYIMSSHMKKHNKNDLKYIKYGPRLICSNLIMLKYINVQSFMLNDSNAQ